MTRILLILSAALLSGCMNMASAPEGGGVYQLVEIAGEAYFLDQRNGALYQVSKNPQGLFDISQQVGQVGLNYAQ